MSINLETLTKELLRLVNIHSYTLNSTEVNAVGEAYQALLTVANLNWEQHIPKDKGFGNLLVARSQLQDTKLPQIVLTGHLDTVYPEHHQQNIRIEDRKLYGPGTIDMKAGLIVMMAVVKELAASNNLKNLTLILTPDEEQMQVERFPVMTELLRNSTHLMVYEGGPPYENFSTKKLVVQRKGYLAYQLKAKASGGHSGMLTSPHERHSAIHELIQQSTKIMNAANYELGTSSNIGTISGGTATNALAQSANIHFDARVVNQTEFMRMQNLYESLASSPFDSEVSLEAQCESAVFPLAHSSANQAFFELAQASGHKLGFTISPEFRGGGSDANRFIYHNPQLAVLDNLGPTGEGDHTEEEFVYLDSLLPSIRLSIGIIKSLLLVS